MDLPGQIERRDLAGLHAVDADSLLDPFGGFREQQHFLELPEWIGRLQGPVDVLAQPFACLGRRGHELRDCATQPVAGGRVSTSACEDERSQHARQ